jgi:hypothetical protein
LSDSHEFQKNSTTLLTLQGTRKKNFLGWDSTERKKSSNKKKSCESSGRRKVSGDRTRDVLASRRCTVPLVRPFPGCPSLLKTESCSASEFNRQSLINRCTRAAGQSFPVPFSYAYLQENSIDEPGQPDSIVSLGHNSQATRVTRAGKRKKVASTTTRAGVIGRSWEKSTLCSGALSCAATAGRAVPTN